jgi:hypothetical protein
MPDVGDDDDRDFALALGQRRLARREVLPERPAACLLRVCTRTL